MRHIFTDGIFAVLSRPGNIGILCFLVILGMMVQLLNKTGGSRVFGNWAQEQIKTRKASMFATMLLGCLIFIDDYFNCLTVGSVMLPVSDKARVSRAKLAYLIDTTAAPICIIAPISSWAAAISGFVEGENGDMLFPVFTLVLFCVIGMLYSGGFFSGTDFVTAFLNRMRRPVSYWGLFPLCSVHSGIILYSVPFLLQKQWRVYRKALSRWYPLF